MSQEYARLSDFRDRIEQIDTKFRTQMIPHAGEVLTGISIAYVAEVQKALKVLRDGDAEAARLRGWTSIEGGIDEHQPEILFFKGDAEQAAAERAKNIGRK
jgi:hypothetical protein